VSRPARKVSAVPEAGSAAVAARTSGVPGLDSAAGTAGAPLRECVRMALDAYLVQLEGHEPRDLYRMVMTEVEAPMLEAVLAFTGGNQTRAAEVLGINRGTLRKKLRLYGLE